MTSLNFYDKDVLLNPLVSVGLLHRLARWIGQTCFVYTNNSSFCNDSCHQLPCLIHHIYPHKSQWGIDQVRGVPSCNSVLSCVCRPHASLLLLHGCDLELDLSACVSRVIQNRWSHLFRITLQKKYIMSYIFFFNKLIWLYIYLTIILQLRKQFNKNIFKRPLREGISILLLQYFY